ncbi:transmembrane protein 213 [Eublepharis macularius]|uniref:Transmembrane protein 213 n=1 Tax=Eublepharis macularius TaxID=481883 RepID=A0AA97JUD7_EUBMA|nr:transmembrane protein 213 [Eublepharis macularius]
MQLLNCMAFAFFLLCSAWQTSVSEVAEHHAENSSNSILCLNVDYCPEAAKCCQLGVDEYGWIAAAVGWSLWFLTLILFCIDKLMKLQPDEPKHLGA